MTWTDEMGKRFFACTGDDYEGTIAASITFYASGRLYRTDWFRFDVHVRRGELLKLEPVNIAARRVRVLVPRGGGSQIRRELTMDVVAANAEDNGQS